MSQCVTPDRHLWNTKCIILNHCLTQMSLKRWLKEFKTDGRDAVRKELDQLHIHGTFLPVKRKSLTDDQYNKVLESHLFLEQKRDNTIKGRLVAGGDRQREYMSKDDVGSPTCALESIMLCATINAEEHRDVATADIPNAFVQTSMEGTVHVRLRGTLAEMLVMKYPEVYREYVSHDKKGQMILYLLLRKALYSIMQAAILFYRKLESDLEGYGFEINPYDPCVANTMINGNQMTILWHVDDIMVPHAEPVQVTKMLLWLKREYETDYGVMKVTRGVIHEYLGITFVFANGSVQITQIPYIHEVLSEFKDEHPERPAATPAIMSLFTVQKDAKSLDTLMSAKFHRFVAKLLYLTKRARPDIATSVAFLTTRVKQPDEDDYKKLIRCIHYLNHTKYMPLTLSSDATPVCKWWVDASYGTHPDCKIQTGSTMSMGKVSIISASVKQKLNTRSSTESELVAVDDMAGHIIWTNHFLSCQGYHTNGTVIYQDNRSALLLEQNGHWSRGKLSKHIDIRYFFIKDHVQAKELTLEWCSTEDMVADMFTKPLMGVKFEEFRKVIMNL